MSRISPVLLTDPSGLTWWDDWNIFWDWVLERGRPDRYHGPTDPRTMDMQKTWAARDMRRQSKSDGCQAGTGKWEWWQAAWDTAWHPWNSTVLQVGGFDYEFTNNGDGTVSYKIKNKLSKESFFYHAYDIPLAGGVLRWIAPFSFFQDTERKGLFPFMGSMTQDFEWTEPHP